MSTINAKQLISNQAIKAKQLISNQAIKAKHLIFIILLLCIIGLLMVYEYNGEHIQQILETDFCSNHRSMIMNVWNRKYLEIVNNSGIKKINKIAMQLLDGNKSDIDESEIHDESYYVNQNDYKRLFCDFTWDYLQSQAKKHQTYFPNYYFKYKAYPLCPVYENNKTDWSFKIIEIHYAYPIDYCPNCMSRHKKSAEFVGFDKSIPFSLDNITDKFLDINSEIINCTECKTPHAQKYKMKYTNAMFYIWKSYITLYSLMHLTSQCDIVCYLDVKLTWRPEKNVVIDDILYVITRIPFGILRSFHPYIAKEAQYTKRDAFILMDMDYKEIYNTIQRRGGYYCIQNNPHSIHFVSEWLYYVSDKRIVTDIPNTLHKPNIKGFKWHRHDQSVGSILDKKWGIYAFEEIAYTHGKTIKDLYDDINNWTSPIPGHWKKYYVDMWPH